jgi:hypothetical protein
MAESFHGIAVYEVKSDGCLNGTWTDDHVDTKKEIYNDIAKKRGGNEQDCIEGTYDCAWIEHSGNIEKGVLVIKKAGSIYDFFWQVTDNSVIYKGIGIKTGNIISVTYW